MIQAHPLPQEFSQPTTEHVPTFHLIEVLQVEKKLSIFLKEILLKSYKEWSRIILLKLGGGRQMIEAIRKRKSIREFSNRKVEMEKVGNILKAAMRSPSSMNGQPWEFIVVDDEEVLHRMKKFSMGTRALETAPMAIVVLEREGLKRRDMGITLLATQDLGACTENIWLQAVEEGLGANWMGVIQGSEGQRLLSKVLNLPDNVKAYAVMAIGYPAEGVDIEPVDRFDKTRVHYNRY